MQKSALIVLLLLALIAPLAWGQDEPDLADDQAQASEDEGDESSEAAEAEFDDEAAAIDNDQEDAASADSDPIDDDDHDVDQTLESADLDTTASDEADGQNEEESAQDEPSEVVEDEELADEPDAAVEPADPLPPASPPPPTAPAPAPANPPQPAPSALPAGTKLYVGNLPFSATEEELRELFSEYGAVADVTIITDRETGRSRGFGYVTFTNTEGANEAIQALDGKDMGGRVLKVNLSGPPTPRPGRDRSW